ncbi:MAG: DUF481 domain-containing protein [Coraliomargaritaceae bacterium]
MHILGRLYSLSSVCFISSRIHLFACLFVSLVSISLSIHGDDIDETLQLIELDTGERLIGSVLPQSTDASLVIRSGLLGELVLPRTRVVGMNEVPAANTESPSAPVKPVEEQASGLTESAEKDTSSDQAVPESQSSATASVEKKEPPMLANTPTEIGLFDYLLGLRAPDSWSGNARVGINISTGDSLWTQTYLRGKLEIRPKGQSSLYRFTGSYTYQENEKANGKKFRSQDKYDLSLLYRYSFENNWFVQNTIKIRADQKKGIDRDLSNLFGFGYGFRPVDKIEFNVGGAGGVADYQSNNANSRNGHETNLSVFEELVWKPLKRTSLVHRFNYYWNPDDKEEFNYVIKTALRVRVTDLLGFEFSYNKSYDNDTGSGNNKDDTRWLNALILFF